MLRALLYVCILSLLSRAPTVAKQERMLHARRHRKRQMDRWDGPWKRSMSKSLLFYGAVSWGQKEAYKQDFVNLEKMLFTFVLLLILVPLKYPPIRDFTLQRCSERMLLFLQKLLLTLVHTEGYFSSCLCAASARVLQGHQPAHK